MIVGLPEGVVTLVFTDIEGSTQLLDRLGADYGAVLEAHHRLLRDVWRAYDGTEVSTDGDAFFVGFASANRAVEAVAAAQAAIAEHPWPFGREVRVRMGVHTGEPQLRDGDYWGMDVHYAARLCSAANGGQVLLSAATRRLLGEVEVEDLGELALKDFATPRRVFHLVLGGRRADAFPPPRTLRAARTNLPSLSTHLVGRESELAELEHRLILTSERMVTVTGPGAGAGAGAERKNQARDRVWDRTARPLLGRGVPRGPGAGHGCGGSSAGAGRRSWCASAFAWGGARRNRVPV